MCVALIDAYFLTGMGYQTTGWFRALASKGHQVRAFCSCYVSNIVTDLYTRPFPEGLTEADGGEVLRLRARQLPRDMVLCSGLAREVAAYEPDMTLAVYPGTLFAGEVFRRRAELRGTLFSTFAENRAQRRATPRVKRALLDLAFRAIKRRQYRRSIGRSDAALLQTPDTFEFVLNRIARGRARERLRAKCALSALGFESSVFRPDAAARQRERTRLGVGSGEVVAVYACKITSVKRLDIWVEVMAAAMRQTSALRAMLIGFREKDAECARVQSLIEATGLGSRFIYLPFASREELPRLYNAADFGTWYLQPSVTIQEAMGTGVYMILTNNPTVSHLVVDPETGRYFPDGDYRQLEELVVGTTRGFAEGAPLSLAKVRALRAHANARRFSYEALADQLVAASEEPWNAVTHLTLASGAVRT
jgi:glycosyltransferase involved in cell wall biosynthesis